MLIYNTTFHAEERVHDNFLIWLKESYIPETESGNILSAPRLCRILSHHDEGFVYSLQWNVESSAMLHRWHTTQGVKFNEELQKIFGDKVTGFPTLMEAIE